MYLISFIIYLAGPVWYNFPDTSNPNVQADEQPILKHVSSIFIKVVTYNIPIYILQLLWDFFYLYVKDLLCLYNISCLLHIIELYPTIPMLFQGVVESVAFNYG